MLPDHSPPTAAAAAAAATAAAEPPLPTPGLYAPLKMMIKF